MIRTTFATLSRSRPIPRIESLSPNSMFSMAAECVLLAHIHALVRNTVLRGIVETGRGGEGKSERGKDRETFHGFIATHSTSNYSSCELACNLAGNTTPGNPGVPPSFPLPLSPPLESARVPRSSSLPLHASAESWTTIAVGQTPCRKRGRGRGSGNGRSIRDTLVAEDVLQTTMYSNTFFFLFSSLSFSFLLFFLLLFFSLEIGIKGSARVNFPFHSFENC